MNSETQTGPAARLFGGGPKLCTTWNGIDESEDTAVRETTFDIL